MADDRLSIDAASLFDNSDARTVEFSGEVDGELRDFAAQYDLLEALDGAAPDAGAVAAARRHLPAIAEAALRALARDVDADRVTVSENDLG
jgi:hypothetical protein